MDKLLFNQVIVFTQFLIKKCSCYRPETMNGHFILAYPHSVSTTVIIALDIYCVFFVIFYQVMQLWEYILVNSCELM